MISIFIIQLEIKNALIMEDPRQWYVVKRIGSREIGSLRPEDVDTAATVSTSKNRDSWMEGVDGAHRIKPFSFEGVQQPATRCSKQFNLKYSEQIYHIIFITSSYMNNISCFRRKVVRILLQS